MLIPYQEVQHSTTSVMCQGGGISSKNLLNQHRQAGRKTSARKWTSLSMIERNVFPIVHAISHNKRACLASTQHHCSQPRSYRREKDDMVAVLKNLEAGHFLGIRGHCLHLPDLQYMNILSKIYLQGPQKPAGRLSQVPFSEQFNVPEIGASINT